MNQIHQFDCEIWLSLRFCTVPLTNTALDPRKSPIKKLNLTVPCPGAAPWSEREGWSPLCDLILTLMINQWSIKTQRNLSSSLFCRQKFRVLDAVKAGECGSKRGSEVEEQSQECKVFNLIGSRRSYTKMATRIWQQNRQRAAKTSKHKEQTDHMHKTNKK